MPRKSSSTSPKRNVWKDPSPYGTYTGESGSSSSWKTAFEQAAYSREKALGILKEVIESPFEILGIPRDASQDVIKTAWRKLCIIHHPDKGGNREKFQQVMAAYSILKDN
jgi:DnaJ-class molecular chaperone